MSYGYGFRGTKETPQQHRKRMIDLMNTSLKNSVETKKSFSVEDFKKNFMFHTGASKVKTDEYFDLVMWMHRDEYEINDGSIQQTNKEQTVNPEQPKV